MNNAQRINQDSGDFEYYTPPEIIEAASLVMRGIDLDPASSEQANRTVRAQRIYTIADDGLTQPWYGKVWMNHPFSRENNQAWIKKLIQEWLEGRTQEACCITYASTSESWFRPLMEFKQCFLQPRTNYLLPNGSVKRGVTKGSAVTYLGHDCRRFEMIFRAFGVVK